MKRLYTLLFNMALISSCSVAKSEKINIKQKARKSAKVRSSKLVNYQIREGDTLYSVAKKHHSTVAKIKLINNMKESDHLSIGKTLKVPTEIVEFAKADKKTAFPVTAQQIKNKNKIMANQKVMPLKTSGKTDKLTSSKIKKIPKDESLVYTIAKGHSVSKTAKDNHISVKVPRKGGKAKGNIILGQKPIASKTKEQKNQVVKSKAGVDNMKPATKLASTKNESISKTKTYEVKKGDSLYRIAINNHTTVDALKKINKIKSEKSLKLGQLLAIPTSTSIMKSTESKIKLAKIGTKRHQEKMKIISASKSSKGKVRIHTVKKGDSLYRIAKSNNITVDMLKKANKITSEKNLKLGQLLSIPASLPENKKVETKVAKVETNKGSKKTKIASVNKTAKTKLLTHTVKKGDSLYIIAKNNHTTVDALKKANKIKSEKNLKLGQLLSIPVSGNKKTEVKLAKAELKKKEKKTEVASTQKSMESKMLTHTVKKGDLLYTIAKNNHTTVDALKKANKIKSAKSLKPGQILMIPGSVDTTSASTKLTKTEKKKEKTKIAKVEVKKKKSVKVAEAKTRQKKKIKIASAKKTSSEKLVFKRKKSKESFLLRLTSGSKSPVKLSAAKKQLGKRYVWGAEGPYAFDCSGFTSYVCKKSGVCLPRRSIDQSKVGKRVSRNNLKPGDLVFFDTSRRHRGYVNHVGIYLGNNKFIHASSAKKKVVIGSLERPFYKSRFKWGRRVKTKS